MITVQARVPRTPLDQHAALVRALNGARADFIPKTRGFKHAAIPHFGVDSEPSKGLKCPRPERRNSYVYPSCAARRQDDGRRQEIENDKNPTS